MKFNPSHFNCSIMKKSILLISALFVYATICLHAQNNVEFTKANFKKDKNLKKIYTSYVKKGDKFYFYFDRGYLVALDYYLMAYQKHPNSAMLNYKIADCYLHTLYKYKALPHIMKAQELDPAVSYDIDYKIGLSNHLGGNFNEAVKYYNKFKSNYKGANGDSLTMATRRIQECNHGIELEQENLYQVLNLGSKVNSEYAEYVPLIRADQSYMLFTSRRPQRKMDSTITDKMIKGERLSGFDMEYHEDIFKVDHLDDSTWSLPCRFDYSTRKKAMHDACVSLSFDGLTIYNYRSKNNGDLYTCQVENGKWTKTLPMKGINTKYREDHIAMAYDNKTVYFVSDRPGGLGGKDIWKSSRKGNGEWMEPENLGPNVNTEYDEEGVFIHPDGKTIYFSSRGHNTMGGFDIFESTFEEGKWTAPLNMGSPVNSPDDDVFFVLTADGKTAYLSSVKEGGYGMQDIYAITAFEKKKHKKTDVMICKGWVVDKGSKTKLNAKVEIIDNSTGTKVYSGNINAEDGFLVSLPTGVNGRNYEIIVEANGYLTHSENFDLVRNKEVGEFKLNEKIVEIEIEKGMDKDMLVLNNIFFDHNQAELKPESKTVLENAVNKLNANPNYKIEIYGHTDDVGSDAYNQQLSEKRVEAVKQYLIQIGFDQKRIVKVAGYGKTKPLWPNDSEEGRYHNRRVEFKLVQ